MLEARAGSLLVVAGSGPVSVSVDGGPAACVKAMPVNGCFNHAASERKVLRAEP